MSFVFIWEQTATCATYSINWLVFITEMKSLYSAVRTASLNKAVCVSSVKGLTCLWTSWYDSTCVTQTHSCWWVPVLWTCTDVRRWRTTVFTFISFRITLWKCETNSGLSVVSLCISFILASVRWWWWWWWYIFNCNWVATWWQLFSTHIYTNNTGNVTKQTIQRTQKYIEQHKKYIEQHNN